MVKIELVQWSNYFCGHVPPIESYCNQIDITIRISMARTSRAIVMSCPKDSDFVKLVNDILEFTTPKYLAKDLGVDSDDIIDWSKGRSLPTGDEMRHNFMLMTIHDVWDN